jgi:hypothetical protein
MKTILISLSLSLFLSGCQALNPAFFTSAEEVLTNNQFELSIDKDAFANGKNIHIAIDIEDTKKDIK